MMMLLRIFVQLSKLSKLPTRSATTRTLEQLPVYFYLIIVLIQFDCFDKSVCFRKHCVCFNSSL